jgi:hypothetical protein
MRSTKIDELVRKLHSFREGSFARDNYEVRTISSLLVEIIDEVVALRDAVQDLENKNA